MRDTTFQETSHRVADGPLYATLFWRGVRLDVVRLKFARGVSTHRLRPGVSLHVRRNESDDGLAVQLDGGQFVTLPLGGRVTLASGYSLLCDTHVPEHIPLFGFRQRAAGVALLLVGLGIFGALGWRAGESTAGASASGGIPTDETPQPIRVPTGAGRVGLAPSFSPVGTPPAPEDRRFARTIRWRSPGRPDGTPAARQRVDGWEPWTGQPLGDSEPAPAEPLGPGDPWRRARISERRGEGAGGLPGAVTVPDFARHSGVLDTGLEDRPRRPTPISPTETPLGPAPPPLTRLVGPVTYDALPEGQVQPEAEDPIVREHLRRAVQVHSRSIRYCYESWGLSANPSLSGRLHTTFRLLPDGAIDQIEVRGEAKFAGVARCAAAQMEDWFFGAGLVEAPRTVHLPFWLHPQDRSGI